MITVGVWGCWFQSCHTFPNLPRHLIPAQEEESNLIDWSTLKSSHRILESREECLESKYTWTAQLRWRNLLMRDLTCYWEWGGGRMDTGQLQKVTQNKCSFWPEFKTPPPWLPGCFWWHWSWVVDAAPEKQHGFHQWIIRLSQPPAALAVRGCWETERPWVISFSVLILLSSVLQLNGLIFATTENCIHNILSNMFTNSLRYNKHACLCMCDHMCLCVYAHEGICGLVCACLHVCMCLYECACLSMCT